MADRRSQIDPTCDRCDRRVAAMNAGTLGWAVGGNVRRMASTGGSDERRNLGVGCVGPCGRCDLRVAAVNAGSSGRVVGGERAADGIKRWSWRTQERRGREPGSQGAGGAGTDDRHPRLRSDASGSPGGGDGAEADRVVVGAGVVVVAALAARAPRRGDQDDDRDHQGHAAPGPRGGAAAGGTGRRRWDHGAIVGRRRAGEKPILGMAAVLRGFPPGRDTASAGGCV